MVGRMKINKVLTTIILASLSPTILAFDANSNGQASGEPQQHSLQNDKNLNLAKLPKLNSGIQVVPISNMYPVTEAKRLLAEFKTQNKKGFVPVKSFEAHELLALRKNKFLVGSKETYLNKDPYDTHLKKSLDQIKLAFPFHELSFVEKHSVIGFAAAGTVQDNAWTGIAETFIYKDINVCDYVIHNLQLTGGSATLAQDFVTYDVNSKPTIITVSGDDTTGFMTQIQWYDDVFYHTLECATKEFIKENKKDIIELANKIDRD